MGAKLGERYFCAKKPLQANLGVNLVIWSAVVSADHVVRGGQPTGTCSVLCSSAMNGGGRGGHVRAAAARWQAAEARATLAAPRATRGRLISRSSGAARRLAELPELPLRRVGGRTVTAVLRGR